jgi:choline-sulfatase
LYRSFRYSFILALVAMSIAAAAVGGWRFAKASAPVSGPIILISVDSLRADRLPPYGYHGVRTPAIDALARDGIVFDRAYSHAPQTLTAHAAILTGRLPFQTGVRNDVGFTLPPEERLVSEMLRDRGFLTAAVVSSYALRRETGISQGFTLFDDAAGGGEHGELALRGGAPLERDGAESLLVALRWLEEVGTERAFLFLHLNEPHEPHAPPPAYAEEYDAYDGEIAYVDQLIGRLAQYLKSHQLYDQSTVIVVGDHGEGLGDHGEQAHGLFVYDEALRVPLIVKPAAGEGAGRRVPDLVQHVDLVPTILGLARAPVPDDLAGRSLEPLLDGSRQFPARTLYAESLFARYHLGASELVTVTDGRYRYIRAPQDELYDLESDPRQRVNLVDDSPQEAARLRASLEQMVPAWIVPPPGAVAPEDRERLASLGSVGARWAPFDASALPDPKDLPASLERYRAAVGFAAARRWPDAIEHFHLLLQAQPDWTDAWSDLGAVAARAGRLGDAADAYRRAAALSPEDADAHLGAAGALLRLRRWDEARAEADLAALNAGARDTRALVSAHGILARIAVARQDSERARSAAEQVRALDPSVPVPAFVEGLLAFDQGRFEEAMPFFEAAIADVEKPGGRPIADLYAYAGDTLVHLARESESERLFRQEIAHFPHHTRAYAALAALYQRAGRPGDVADVLSELVRLNPTAEAYNLSARLWDSFGNRRQAAAVRAEGHRTITSGRPSPPRVPR